MFGANMLFLLPSFVFPRFSFRLVTLGCPAVLQGHNTIDLYIARAECHQPPSPRKAGRRWGTTERAAGAAVPPQSDGLGPRHSRRLWQQGLNAPTHAHPLLFIRGWEDEVKIGSPEVEASVAATTNVQRRGSRLRLESPTRKIRIERFTWGLNNKWTCQYQMMGPGLHVRRIRQECMKLINFQPQLAPIEKKRHMCNLILQI